MSEPALLWGESPSVLFDLAEILLAECAERLEEAGRTPDRVCVYPGDIPDEWGVCSILAVSVPSIALTSAFPAPASNDRWDCRSGQGVADLIVMLNACVPNLTNTGQAPPAKAMTEASRKFYADVWRVWAGLLCAAQIWAGQSDDEERDVVVRGGEVTGPLAGVVRATFRVGVSVSA